MSYGTVQAEKLTTESGYSLGAGNASSFKNRIINGDMSIDQRQLGAAVTVAPSASGYFGIDRYNIWSFPGGAAGTWTWQQQTATPPVGFTYYGRATVTTADSSVAGNDYYTIQQAVEGFNTADFEFGTANAKPFTVSFWARSSITGTFSCSSYFANASLGYPLTYTINAANTWEYKTISFPAFTSASLSGTPKTTSASLYLVFSLGMGSSFTGTAGVLAASAYGAAGATNLISTNGATFDITGIQLEVGTVATSFDYLPITTELSLCERYFQRYSLQSSFPFVGRTLTDNRVQINFPLRTEMRATPTLITSAINSSPGVNVYFGTSLVALNGTQTYGLSGHETTSVGGFLISGGGTNTANQIAAVQINGSIQLMAEL
jgi:hypothetical protein